MMNLRAAGLFPCALLIFSRWRPYLPWCFNAFDRSAPSRGRSLGTGHGRVGPEKDL